MKNGSNKAGVKPPCVFKYVNNVLKLIKSLLFLPICPHHQSAFPSSLRPSVLSSPPCFLRPGGGGVAGSGEGPGGEAGDAEDEADGGQGQAEGAGEAQDPAGAAPGVEDQDAGAAGRPAETTQGGQEGKNTELIIHSLQHD